MGCVTIIGYLQEWHIFLFKRIMVGIYSGIAQPLGDFMSRSFETSAHSYLKHVFTCVYTHINVKNIILFFLNSG